jgi:amino acid permease
MGGAIVVNDISTVFEFISAICVTAIGFWFPAHYYLLAEKKYGQNKP